MNRVVALASLQFSLRVLVGEIHLVRMVANGGTPGPTLCGLDRFAAGAPGWSVGGGVTGAGIELKPCRGCEEVAGRDYPAAPVWTSIADGVFRRHGKAPWDVRHLPVVAIEKKETVA
ncbi:hypothetical protein GALAXY_56 [Arthrobacter phage Galaxy]|uniref:Uncharacterized protein n=1 Tax=Arthrobacter phage Galaxy TaxID=1772326 RepID=A0A0U4JGC9_9CAUD|nr:hypothetical protein FDG93_gp56 [Arthrobacter phage Galaxy]ALY08900.1 hypothetical protein GALAXY_56 [Arthrobacter phage Galaxy]